MLSRRGCVSGTVPKAPLTVSTRVVFTSSHRPMQLKEKGKQADADHVQMLAVSCPAHRGSCKFVRSDVGNQSVPRGTDSWWWTRVNSNTVLFPARVLVPKNDISCDTSLISGCGQWPSTSSCRTINSACRR